MDQIADIRSKIQDFIKNGLYQEAKQLMQENKELLRQDEVASIEAVMNIYAGNLSEAMQCIQRGLRCNIYSGDLYYNMGIVYEARAEYDRAYLCYEQASKFINDEKSINIISSDLFRLKSDYNITVNPYSIIILTYNNLEYTKLCIESIMKYNGNDEMEIIVVDNNSTDGTVEWLKNRKGIRYILNEENKGFPAGCNQGISLAKKENDIFLLNNDTVVMPNSIFNLRMALYSHSDIGAAGPISNSVTNYQQIVQKFDTFNEYTQFAKLNNITNESLYEKRIKLVGFAMFIKREALNKVGLLDERFTPGNFEDDDLSYRIIKQGYKLLLCLDSYIHHFGGVSFKKTGEKYAELMKVNAKKFEDKWGFSSGYSSNIRYDLISYIKREIRDEINVLEIGCGCGATLLSIKNRYPNSRLFGIEINENSAEIAEQFADIKTVDIEDSVLDYEENYFDYIILADVLEHLINPYKVVKSLKKYLNNSGYILASIPNVMHFSVIKELINGRWTYEDSGILDRTHLRFFTKHEIINMFKEAEYKEIDLAANQIYESSDDKKFIEEISKLANQSNKDEFSAYQYIISAKKTKYNADEIERKITFLLRRIEFNMEEEKNTKELIDYIKSKEINQKDIVNSVIKGIVNKVYILNYIAVKCCENNIYDMALSLLENAHKLEPDNKIVNDNLDYVLSYFK